MAVTINRTEEKTTRDSKFKCSLYGGYVIHLILFTQTISLNQFTRSTQLYFYTDFVKAASQAKKKKQESNDQTSSN